MQRIRLHYRCRQYGVYNFHRVGNDRGKQLRQISRPYIISPLGFHFWIIVLLHFGSCCLCRLECAWGVCAGNSVWGGLLGVVASNSCVYLQECVNKLESGLRWEATLLGKGGRGWGWSLHRAAPLPAAHPPPRRRRHLLGKHRGASRPAPTKWRFRQATQPWNASYYIVSMFPSEYKSWLMAGQLVYWLGCRFV